MYLNIFRFGFVNFKTHAEALAAIKKMHGAMYEGVKIEVLLREKQGQLRVLNTHKEFSHFSIFQNF